MHPPAIDSIRPPGRASILLAAVLCLTACVSDSADREVVAVDEAARAGAGGVSYAQLLRNLDGRVDRFVYLTSRSGAEAMRERELLASALAAVVSQNEPALVSSLRIDEPERRRIAAKALGFSVTDDAVDALGEALETGTDARLLVNAAFALSRRQSPRTNTAALVAHLGAADADLRSNALMALWHAVDARRSAGLAPLEAGDLQQALPRIEAALFDPDDPFVRAHAAATLGALGDPRSVDALINLLRDEHPFVRTHTALALGKIGDVKAVPALVTLIDESPRGTPRSAVVTALSALIEGSGGRVPEYLGESQPAWTAFVRTYFAKP